MFEKHLWKSDILSEDASKNQLPGLSVSGTLVKNGLKLAIETSEQCVKSIQS